MAFPRVSRYQIKFRVFAWMNGEKVFPLEAKINVDFKVSLYAVDIEVEDYIEDPRCELVHELYRKCAKEYPGEEIDVGYDRITIAPVYRL